LALDDWDARDDCNIRVFLKSHLLQIREEQHCLLAHLPELWPPTAELDQLIKNSEDSFIWASTVFVEDGLPHEQLRLCLKAHAGLYPLYHEVLLRTPRSDDFRRVFGSVMLVRTPLSIEDISRLINLGPDKILGPLQRLKQILMIPRESNEAIRPFHSSLLDFLMECNPLKEDLFVYPAVVHFDLALHWIEIITKYIVGTFSSIRWRQG
jgi:hypothetical protein